MTPIEYAWISWTALGVGPLVMFILLGVRLDRAHKLQLAKAREAALKRLA